MAKKTVEKKPRVKKVKPDAPASETKPAETKEVVKRVHTKKLLNEMSKEEINAMTPEEVNIRQVEEYAKWREKERVRGIKIQEERRG